MTCLAVASITLCPLPIVFIAWDTTRLMSYGFFGMLVAIAMLVSARDQFRPRGARAFHVLMMININISMGNFQDQGKFKKKEKPPRLRPGKPMTVA